MKKSLPVFLAFLFFAIQGFGQNVFDPNDQVVTYNGSNTPATPQNTFVKWIRTVRQDWNTDNFKSYYYNGMSFRLRYPNGYNPNDNTKKYPVILFLHGAGEIAPATDNEYQLIHGAQQFEQQMNNGEFNAFMLFPQVNGGSGWDDSYFSRINTVLDALKQYCHTDEDRIIPMGLSNGAFGAILYSTYYPERSATVISASPALVFLVSGTQYLNRIIQIPYWIANGGTDINPSPSEVKVFVDSVRNRGGNIRQSYFPQADHGTWYDQWAEPYLVPYWKAAHKANPIVYFDRRSFPTEAQVNARMGITGNFAQYQWQRNNIDINGATSNEYTATQYGTYRVRFKRTSGSDWSEWSPNPVEIFQDVSAPSVPQSLSSSYQGRNFAYLVWNPSTDNVGVTSYDVYVNGTKTYNTSNRSITADNLAPNTNYNFSVVARDSAGNTSSVSNVLSVSTTSPSNGVKWRLYTKYFDSLQNYNTLSPDATGSNATIDINVRPSGIGDWFSFVWEGNINLPTSGSYTFELVSDDGSRFYFDSFYNPSANPVINLPVGGNQAVTFNASAGLHPFAISYYEKLGGEHLQLYWTRPGGARELVPASAFMEGSSGGDATPPTAPSNLQVVSTAQTSANLSWNGSTDNIGVTGYDVYINNVKSTTVTGTTATVSGLTAATTYSFTVLARDGAGNTSGFSNAVNGTTSAGNPSGGNGLNYKFYIGTFNTLPNFATLTPAKTGTSANVDISVRPAGEDWNYGFVWEGYIYIPEAGNYTFETKSDDGSKLYFGSLYSNSNTATVDNDGTHSNQNYVAGSVNVNTPGYYPISITFFQKSDGQSMEVFWTGPSFGRQKIPNSAFFLTLPQSNDVTPPSTPANLIQVGAAGPTTVSLDWDNATDNVGVTSYDVYANGTKITNVTSSAATINTLSPSTLYTFQVKALDGAGNTSGFSNSLAVTTAAAGNNGLNYRFYEGVWTVLPDFSTLTPAKTGISATADISVRPTGVDWNYGFVWEGYINLPSAGTYTFETKSDDGSKLYFNSFYSPSVAATVNNDGTHSASAGATGTISVAAGGYYRIAVTYFQKGDGQSLDLYWTGPNFARTLIPSSAFFLTAPTSTDNIAPSIPTGLVVVGTPGPNSIDLDWANSTDNVGVTGYEVYVNNAKVMTATVSNATVSGLTPSTSYNFYIKAVDAAGNVSGESASINGSTGAASTNGVNYRFYEGVWTTLPNFSALTPKRSGISANVDISVRPAGYDWNYGFVWEAYMYFPAAGTYFIETKSDDGSKFYFNSLYNNSVPALVNNDGTHSNQNAVGANLTINTPGWYPVAVTYFQKGDGQSMELYWTGPGIARQIIPATTFKPIDPAAPTVINAVSGISSANAANELSTNDDASGNVKLLKAYPNPIAGVLTIDFYNTTASDVNVDVFDMNGKMIFKQNFGNRSIGRNTLKLNLTGSKFAPGLYLAKIMVDGKPAQTIKLVKTAK